MEPVEYDETIHPEVWLNKIKACCYKNKIGDIIGFCKYMIHPSIDVSKASTFDEILNILKSDALFTLFKYSVKEKLQMLKFDHKNDDHIRFISIFRKYCYEAEINDVKEQKNLLLKKISKDSFQYCFINSNLEKIKSLNDLVIYFNQSFLEQRESIHFGSCITLKHVATGKYLTSSDVQYKTGSERNIVFASQTLSNPYSLWNISNPDQKDDNRPVIYGKSKFYLINKSVDKCLVISHGHKSPSTGNWEVRCFDSRYMYLTNGDSTNNNSTYIKSKEIINIYDKDNYILRSHEFPFTINNDTYQEVVGHKERIDGNDKWCIELFE
ncbi:hypothetical protein RclHR1_03500011 [Rhizophagus clarus]|uniref:MIR domain-containing protein n=1 Tax=Rhizophagus clarus TaxID=94130 RepID=A0A2Z6S597_9GLOM|nr:hypothetical protein RclHR1_03500011 [Rhizophagus clarus]